MVNGKNWHEIAVYPRQKRAGCCATIAVLAHEIAPASASSGVCSALTATRVSSRCRASISIRMVIYCSPGARSGAWRHPPRADCDAATWWRNCRPCPCRLWFRKMPLLTIHALASGPGHPARSRDRRRKPVGARGGENASCERQPEEPPPRNPVRPWDRTDARRGACR